MMRSLCSSTSAIKQTPARQQQQPVARLRSGTEEEVQRLDFAEPLMAAAQRGAVDRRSYNTPYAKTPTAGPNSATAVATVLPSDTE